MPSSSRYNVNGEMDAKIREELQISPVHLQKFERGLFWHSVEPIILLSFKTEGAKNMLRDIETTVTMLDFVVADKSLPGIEQLERLSFGGLKYGLSLVANMQEDEHKQKTYILDINPLDIQKFNDDVPAEDFESAFNQFIKNSSPVNPFERNYIILPLWFDFGGIIIMLVHREHWWGEPESDDENKDEDEDEDKYSHNYKLKQSKPWKLIMITSSMSRKLDILQPKVINFFRLYRKHFGEVCPEFELKNIKVKRVDLHGPGTTFEKQLHFMYMLRSLVIKDLDKHELTIHCMRHNTEAHMAEELTFIRKQIACWIDIEVKTKMDLLPLYLILKREERVQAHRKKEKEIENNERKRMGDKYEEPEEPPKKRFTPLSLRLDDHIFPLIF